MCIHVYIYEYIKTYVLTHLEEAAEEAPGRKSEKARSAVLRQLQRACKNLCVYMGTSLIRNRPPLLGPP